MRLESQKSLLLVIDIQEKLFPLQSYKEDFIKNSYFILDVAKTLNIDIEATEQYPKGLGHTLSEISAKLSNPIQEKTSFSAFDSLTPLQDTHVIICGMEAHICVLQTALDFKAAGFDTYVITDAISARSEEDKKIALQRMTQAGITPVTTEMLAYEWMQSSDHEKFRDINTLMKQK